MRLPDDTPFLADSAARKVCSLITNARFRVYFVGGCVRNAVLGEAQSDIDLSTNALPQQVLHLAKDAGIKAVPTGIDHGTVTLVVDETPFEVTTFRRDVQTDGRRAVVAFSDNIEEDALRRDFTMNALYATPEGEIVDPLDGIPDAMARRVVFIQDARARIREDYLRSLRFFRFWAWYGDKTLGFDPETLSAISDTLDGLETLSAERVGAELLKLLAAADPAQAVATMAHLGVFTRLLPIQDTVGLFRLLELEQRTETPPDPLRRLAALGPQGASERLRLSKRNSRALQELTQALGAPHRMRALGARFGAQAGWDIALLNAALLETVLTASDRQHVETGSQIAFPIKPADLMPAFQGKALGDELERLRGLWLASDLKLKKNDLLG